MKDSYPSGSSGKALRTDNNGKSRAWRVSDSAALWVNGKDCLDDLISSMEQGYQVKINAVMNQIDRCHTKTVKGKLYWYEWTDGCYKYAGKEDPRPELEKKLLKLEQQRAARKKEMLSCVIVPMSRHYVISLDKTTFSVAGQEITRLFKLIELSKKPRAQGPPGG